MLGEVLFAISWRHSQNREIRRLCEVVKINRAYNLLCEKIFICLIERIAI